MKVPHRKLRSVVGPARTYSAADIAAIIAAIPGGLPSGPVDIRQASPDGNGSIPCLVDRRELLIDCLETAASRYFTWKHLKNSASPSKTVKKLHAIETASKKLLEALGLDDSKCADDLPDDIPHEILIHLNRQAEIISAGIRQAARFREIDGGGYAGPTALREAILGVMFIKDAAADAKMIVDLRVDPDCKRNKGDEELRSLFGDLIGTWLEVFELPIAMSVGKPGSPGEGIPSGPFIRFIQACLMPLKIDLTPDAIRDRARPFQGMGKLVP